MHRLRFPFLGYTVVLHWSWLVAVSLITWSLSTGYYPKIWPDFPRTLYWLSGLMSTLMLFFSILLHECAHAGVATYHGIRIKEIMLHIVGGWTMLPKEVSTPRLEALVAIAGPLCSAMIGLLLLPWSDFPIAYYIMHFNFVLAFYNLIPAFPMDGGRILRSWYWAQQGSFAQATERASLLGKRIAIGMILIGITGLFLNWSTFWLMIGGVILRLVSDGQHHNVAFSHMLKGTVRDIMIPAEHVLCVAETQTVHTVKQLFLRYGYHQFPVLRDGKLIGIVQHTALRAHPDWETDRQTPLVDLVEPVNPEIIVSPSRTINDAFDDMLLSGSPRLLVYDRGRFIGLVTRASVTRLRELNQKPSQLVTLTGGSPQTAAHQS